MYINFKSIKSQWNHKCMVGNHDNFIVNNIYVNREIQ